MKSTEKEIDITNDLTEEDAIGAEKIEGGRNEFRQRYLLKDGRKVDVTPSGKYLLVEEGKDKPIDEKVNESTEYVSELMDKFNINLEQAADLDKIVDEILEMDNLDERMDYVEGLALWDITDDEKKEEEIMEYLKDLCIG